MIRKTLRRLFIVLTGFLIGLGCAEFLAHGWLDSHSPRTYLDYLLEPSPAYIGAPYWSVEFAQALREWQRHRAASNFVGTYKSKYFSENGGWRQTAYQPTVARHTIYMIGSSNLYNSELPDDQTISSQLQLHLNKVMPGAYRVVNLGANGAIVARQLLTLEQLSLVYGDIVVFYDGFQEVATIYWPFVRQRDFLPYEQPCKWLLENIKQSSFIVVLCSWVNVYIPAYFIDPEKLQPSITNTAHNYYSTLLNADSFATSHGATFFHFMQPHLWSRSLSRPEQDLAANVDLVPDKLEQLTLLAWPALQGAASEASQHGVRTYDLTHILDDLRADIFIFFDVVHTNERGNALIAAAIFRAITTL